MLRLLFWCLLILPIAELLVLIQVGQGLGFWPTLALLVVAGIAGLRLMRWQSARTLQRVATLGLERSDESDEAAS